MAILAQLDDDTELAQLMDGLEGSIDVDDDDDADTSSSGEEESSEEQPATGRSMEVLSSLCFCFTPLPRSPSSPLLFWLLIVLLMLRRDWVQPFRMNLTLCLIRKMMNPLRK